mgnify:CR=1 FL=1
MNNDFKNVEQLVNDCKNLVDGAQNRTCKVNQYEWGYDIEVPYFEFLNSFMWVKVNGLRFKIRSIEIYNENICFIPGAIGGSDINVSFDEFESFEITSCYKGNK